MVVILDNNMGKVLFSVATVENRQQQLLYRRYICDYMNRDSKNKLIFFKKNCNFEPYLENIKIIKCFKSIFIYII